MDIIILASVLIIVFCFCIIYYLFALKLDFSIPTILRDFSKCSGATESLCHLVKLSLKKVNGWNRMTMFYTILHYTLNLASIIFSCVSIYFSFFNKNNISIFTSMLALISLTCNLFLRCERKWATFRRVLAKSRIETNKFVSAFKNAPDLEKETTEYANKIIELEVTLKDSDLT